MNYNIVPEVHSQILLQLEKGGIANPDQHGTNLGLLDHHQMGILKADLGMHFFLRQRPQKKRTKEKAHADACARLGRGWGSGGRPRQFGEICNFVSTNQLYTMPELFRFFGMKFYFFSREHLPIHVHVENADGDAKFEIKPVKLVENRGMKNKDLKNG